MLLHLTDFSNEPLHHQLVRQLRWKILSEELSEGSELPSARTLAREERVSASSVERAYAELAEEGLVERVDDRFRVSPIEATDRRELERARLHETLRERELTLKELELARDIQCRLLPPPEVEGPGFGVAARNEPARFVTGDFYDVFHGSDGGVSVVVADVSGKGLGPSLLMASVKAVLPFIAADRGVAETLTELNRKLVRELGQREFVALAYARFDPKTGRLILANAGLPDPYHLRPGRPPRPLVAPEPRLPLGLRDEVVYGAHEIVLEPGERLLFATDGLPEARTPAGEPVGYDGLERLVADLGENTASEWLDELFWRLRGLSTALPDDDRTAVLIERRWIERRSGGEG